MNRLATWQKTTTSSMEPLQFSKPMPAQQRSCEKAIFVPLKYEPKHAYPLLIWLHDSGQAESSVREVMPAISLRNFLAVAPRGSYPPSSGDGSHPATAAWTQTVEGIQAAEDAIAACIDAVSQRYHVASAQIFVAGWGSGGTMALRLAFRNPARFAGCASLGGAFPENLCPLQDINRARGLNVLLVQSDELLNYGTDQFCSDVRLMYLAGAKLHVRQYHPQPDARKVILADVNRWLMGIVTNQDLFQTTNVPLNRPERN